MANSMVEETEHHVAVERGPLVYCMESPDAKVDTLDDLVIPAGIGFMRCMEQYPEIELWDADGQHPSPAGTYLAACTAYAVVYQQSPENCTYIGDLDGELAGKLQKIAAELVLG